MNFSRILSKSSLRSSTSSGKSLNQIDEVKKIQDETESLKLNISSLKALLESRDIAIGTLAREKEKLYVELKSLQRTNRNLQQELIDEREIQGKEKEFLLVNMKRLAEKLTASGRLDSIMNEEECISALESEIASKDEIICNVCNKYFKLKKSKDELQKKFLTLQKYVQETYGAVVKCLELNKKSVSTMLDDIGKSANITPAHRKYITLAKTNADLKVENARLKLRLRPTEARWPAAKLGLVSTKRFCSTTFSNAVRYKSMSDTFLPTNFYK